MRDILKKTKEKKGFTLIEMLITTSIILIVTGGSIAGFITFNDRQKVQIVAKELQTMFRSAQIKAKTGEGASGDGGASGCSSGTNLSGYKVKNSTNSIIMQRVCVNSSGTETFYIRESYDLPNGVIITAFDVKFLSLFGGTDIAGPNAITIQGLTMNSVLRITDSGELTIF